MQAEDCSSRGSETMLGLPCSTQISCTEKSQPRFGMRTVPSSSPESAKATEGGQSEGNTIVKEQRQTLCSPLIIDPSSALGASSAGVADGAQRSTAVHSHSRGGVTAIRSALATATKSADCQIFYTITKAEGVQYACCFQIEI